ncbi:hypothetical protein ACI2K4_03650 [Micromonospora sp. NPDC050397]|uniref:hypothetical protein n=1 Tax=Micromonospora sp. NPDC050397 TaxID=3364279 RepID=UPI00384B8198
MAIEWSTRANRSFSLAEAAQRTEVLVAELLGRPAGRLSVQVQEADRERLADSRPSPIATEELTRRRDPFGEPEPRSTHVRLTVPELPALAFVLIGRYMPRIEDDPHTGMVLTVSSARTNESYVLSIAAISAFAGLTGSEVMDESGYLKGEWLTPPGRLIERLRVVEPAPSLAAAVDAVLAKTSLRRDHEPLTVEQL